ncbi:hypothetical protein TUSST3_38930 [Streptomyces sp. TUS-ST3]|nr:hypothetical protein TUSST3_38930 [Streptomyces sp. TUS-ST3]
MSAPSGRRAGTDIVRTDEGHRPADPARPSPWPWDGAATARRLDPGFTASSHGERYAHFSTELKGERLAPRLFYESDADVSWLRRSTALPGNEVAAPLAPSGRRFGQSFRHRAPRRTVRAREERLPPRRWREA